MEIEKEKRLPAGYHSWTQLAQHIHSQDELSLTHNSDIVRMRAFVPIYSSQPDLTHEIFECDIASLKIRAFDELKEILPDRDNLMRMIVDFYECRTPRDFDVDLLRFLKGLSELLEPDLTKMMDN